MRSAKRALKGTGAALLILVGTSCRNYLFEFQPNETISGKLTDITIDRPSEADILVVVDNSGSMAANQANLANSTLKFVTQLAASPNSFRIAVTTTDLIQCTPGVPNDPNRPWDGLCGRFLSSDGSDPIIRREDFPVTDAGNAALAAKFQADVLAAGTSGSAYEQGLKAAYTAVSPELQTASLATAFNQGFLRQEALLGIIIVSDESDCSFGLDATSYSTYIETDLLAGESCYKYYQTFGGETAAPEDWANRLVQIKGSASLISVATITGAVTTVDAAGNKVLSPSGCQIGPSGPTNDCSCFYKNGLDYCDYTTITTPPPGDSLCGGNTVSEGSVQNAGTSCICGEVDPTDPNTINKGHCCTALANDRYQSFAQFFTPNVVDSICQNDFSAALYEVANIFTRDCFPISSAPLNNDPSNIQVKKRASGTSTYVLVPNIPYSPDFTGNGWFLQQFTDTTGTLDTNICLSGTYKRAIGDSYEIFTVDGAEGVNSLVPAGATGAR